jgi:hypothetical protein
MPSCEAGVRLASQGKEKSMPVTEDPRVADELAQFGDAANPAASIRYNVPLPGAYSFQRVVPIEVDPGWFTGPDAFGTGMSLRELEVLTMTRTINSDRLSALYQRTLPPTAQPSVRLAAEVGGVGVVTPELPTTSDGERRKTALASEQPQALATLAMIREDGRSVVDQGSVDIQRLRREHFLEGLAQREAAEFEASSPRTLQVPVPALGHSVQTVDYDLDSHDTPRIALVETWQMASFLGDYGLGRTLQTFSLLPGERTTITVESWRTDSATREDASSVFDSSDTAAQTRFSSALTLESGSAFQDQGGWALSVGAKAGFDFGLVQASVETGFSANHQEARQQFSNNTTQASRDHASQVNATRRQTVESTSSTTTATGLTQTTVREITNTNLRRVLNFVFRELNQTYQTVISLRDVRIAFYNGNVGSAEIVPLADLRRLLEKYIDPVHQEELARGILALIVECIDHEGTPQTMLEVGTREGGRYNWEDATLDDNGELDFPDNPLDRMYSWRIKRAPIPQDDGDDSPITPHVPGVVTARDSIVLRTDNVVVEALLGQADALDPYATALQASDLQSREADIEAREAQTRRTTDALDLVQTQSEDEKVDAFERILGEEPDIEVVPVAAVSNDRNQ